MQTFERCSALTLLCMFVAGGGVASASPPDAGRSPHIDLVPKDPHTDESTDRPTPAGTVLRPPRSSLVAPAQYLLEPTSSGGYLYRGSSFDARIAKNGRVTFSSSGSLFAPPGAAAIPGREPFATREPSRVGGRPGLRFDLTDEYLRKLHKDPARDGKAAFLAGTFTLRMKLALDARSELRHAALTLLPAQLEHLWRDPQFTASEREHLLRATWDGFSPETPDGAAAREIVADFARRHLPPQKAAPFAKIIWATPPTIDH